MLWQHCRFSHLLCAVPTNSDVHFFELPHFCSLFSRVSSQGPTWEAVSIKLKFPGEECPRTFLAPKFSEAWCAHYLWKLLYMCLSRLCTTIPKYKMEIGLITPSICARDKVIGRFILLSLSVSHSVGKKKHQFSRSITFKSCICTPIDHIQISDVRLKFLICLSKHQPWSRHYTR